MLKRPDLPGPNKPCVCGSKRKFKKCCYELYQVPTLSMIETRIKELKLKEELEQAKIPPHVSVNDDNGESMISIGTAERIM